MSIYFDVNEIENASGSGENRQYIHPLFNGTMSRRKLSESICRNCSLKASDVEAVLTELGEVMCEKLASGHRVYLPEIGYFSLKLGIDMPDGHDKVTGAYLRVRNINFKPEASVLNEIRRRVRFERAKKTMKSQKYTDEEMTAGMEMFFANNVYITRRIMENEFNLRKGMALYWLSRLVEQGVLTKGGNHRSPVYHKKYY